MQSAQQWARTKLTHKFPNEYRKFYLEEKEKQTGYLARSRAQSKAKSRLVQRHLKEYSIIYKEALDRGYPIHSTRGGI